MSNGDNREIARQLLISIASHDEFWEPGDERLVTVAPTGNPSLFTFAIASFVSEYGCVTFRDGPPEVWFHRDEIERCVVCGWMPDTWQLNARAEEREPDNAGGRPWAGPSSRLSHIWP
jgi:hypothetical protein